MFAMYDYITKRQLLREIKKVVNDVENKIKLLRLEINI